MTCTSKKEAQKILRDHQKSMAAGTAAPPVKNTLSECTKDFIDYKALTLEKTTIYGYTNIWKNHIQPYFKDRRIQDITAKDIQDYVSKKVKTGLSTNSVKKHLALMYSVFKNAYITGLISQNPLDRLDRIKSKSHQLEYMNTQEIARLCASVAGTQLEIPVLLAAYLGLRRGEVLGLKWEHIDFENATLSVENTRTMAGNDLIEKSPKTERSTRQLALPQFLIDVLMEHKAGRRKNIRHDYVVTMRNGEPFKPNYLTDAFREHLIKNGLKQIRFHDLRHSFASIANDAGTSTYEISATMGHSNIVVTSGIYTHAFSQRKAKAIDAVALSIENAKIQENAI